MINILWETNIMKLLVMWSALLTCYLFFLVPKILSSAPHSRTPSE
jgi:hypothetical protein